MKNVEETRIEAGELDTLSSTVKAARLVETLRKEKLTVITLDFSRVERWDYKDRLWNKYYNVEMEKMKNIVENNIKTDVFDTLTAAAKAAGLAETLSTETLTVFAPNDEAFAKLPAGTVEGLHFDKEKLTEILTYHIVAGKHMASELMNMRSIKTLQGGELELNIKKSMVNDAKVLRPDIECSNGVCHMIDSVLIP